MKHQISPIPLTRDRKFSIGVVLLVLYSGFLALKKIYIRCGSPRHSYKSLHRVFVQWKEGQKHQVGISDKVIEKSQTRTMVRAFDLKLDLFAEHLCCIEKCKCFLVVFFTTAATAFIYTSIYSTTKCGMLSENSSSLQANKKDILVCYRFPKIF